MPNNTYGVSSGLWANYGDLFQRAIDRRPPTAYDRLGNLATMLQGQAGAYTNPFTTLGFQTQMGSIRDVFNERADTDAARAGALGLSPGFAAGAGAAGRSRALAEAVRGAASGAEQQASDKRTRAQMLLASVLGNVAALDEAKANREAQEKGSFMSLLGTLGGAAIGTLIAPGVGTAIGAGIGGGAGHSLGGNASFSGNPYAGFRF